MSDEKMCDPVEVVLDALAPFRRETWRPRVRKVLDAARAAGLLRDEAREQAAREKALREAAAFVRGDADDASRMGGIWTAESLANAILALIDKEAAP
jgi:hypothetical protein